MKTTFVILLVIFSLIFFYPCSCKPQSEFPVEILSVETGEYFDGSWFNKITYSHLELVKAKITLKVNTVQSMSVYLTFSLTDSLGYPILFSSYIHEISETGTEIISTSLGVLPKYAKLGEATLSVNTLTNLPIDGGIPLCPQANQKLTIWWNIADVNFDLTIDFFDIVLVGISYGATESDIYWNKNCDIAMPYGVIDIYDIGKVARNL